MLSPGGTGRQRVLCRVIGGPAAFSDDILNIFEMVSVVLASVFDCREHFGFAVDIDHLHDSFDMIGDFGAGPDQTFEKDFGHRIEGEEELDFFVLPGPLFLAQYLLPVLRLFKDPVLFIGTFVAGNALIAFTDVKVIRGCFHCQRHAAIFRGHTVEVAVEVDKGLVICVRRLWHGNVVGMLR